MNHFNEGAEELTVSRAKKLPFLYSSRQVFLQPGATEHYGLIFEDISNEGVFPIVFLGDWNMSELTPSFVESIASNYVGGARTCLIVTRNARGNAEINIFGKKHDDELPYINTEPVHSTHAMQWAPISTHEVAISKTGEKIEDTRRLAREKLTNT